MVVCMYVCVSETIQKRRHWNCTANTGTRDSCQETTSSETSRSDFTNSTYEMNYGYIYSTYIHTYIPIYEYVSIEVHAQKKYKIKSFKNLKNLPHTSQRINFSFVYLSLWLILDKYVCVYKYIYVYVCSKFVKPSLLSFGWRHKSSID